jgi:hypothetical protein
MMFQVDDADRVLQFEGELLAHSSSHTQGAQRWVEFDLYRTSGGSYVVARTGYSVLFHRKGCDVVRRGRHSPAPAATLTEDSRPCPLCSPEVSMDLANELVYPEKPLHWALVCKTADAAVEALAKYDSDGSRYFTHVARELIRRASSVDSRIRTAYAVEIVA